MSNSFIPPQRTLMGPGPSDVSSRVLSALSRPTIGHLDPDFVGLMDEIKALLQFAFQTRNELTIPISAPGSAGMEACFVNLLQEGDKVIICQNGVFGGRMKENVERIGATAVMVDSAWGSAIDIESVAHAFEQHPDTKVLAFVHAETSTGVLSDAKALCQLASQQGALSIVDTVTSLGGVAVDIDEWGADAVFSGSQKCLSCVPGISPVTFSQKAVELINSRKTKVRSWFLDMNLIMGYWGASSKRVYHHTAPVNNMYALHEALLILQEEGLQAAWQRHRLHHNALVAGLEAMGLSMIVDTADRLPQLNLVAIPHGVDDAAVRGALLKNFSLEIGAGLGAFSGKAWRIGLMGHAANTDNVTLCLNALESVLADQGADIHIGRAEDAALATY